jgi:glycerophosphoryl diester phosphodiesterase
MSARPVPDWLTRWEYAHRGLHGDGVPENSLAAAKAAIAVGMGIECDVQRSADGQPMVLHDWELSRLTGEAGETESRTADQIEMLTYSGSEERPARLTKLLETIAAKVPLLIEIKSKRGYDVAPTCASVSTHLENYAGEHAVMSFDPRVAAWFRKNSPATLCGLVMREDEVGYTHSAWQRRIAYWIAQPDFLAYHVEALPSAWVSRLRNRGLPILTWTVNSPQARGRALQHADGLVSEGEGLA